MGCGQTREGSARMYTEGGISYDIKNCAKMSERESCASSTRVNNFHRVLERPHAVQVGRLNRSDILQK